VCRRRDGFALGERGGSVDTHGQVRVTIAGLEVSFIVVGGHVPFTSKDIKDVVAETCGVRAGGKASPDTELGIGHEIGPLVVLDHRARRVSEHQSTDRVAIPVGTMRIQLSSFVTSRDADLSKVTPARDLNIVGSLNPMGSDDSAVREEPGSISVLQAPGDFDSLCLRNSGVRSIGIRRAPKAKVGNAVDEEVLA